MQISRATSLDHPIPSLTHLDIVGLRPGGGAELVIVIAKPLQSDDYSLNRLLDKIEGYLGHINSKSFIEEAGDPKSNPVTIVVKLHPESCPEAFQLLQKSKEWAKDNNAALRMEMLSDT